ncbi:MAG: hypothetical protein RH982_04500 [Parvibaculum sp.]
MHETPAGGGENRLSATTDGYLKKSLFSGFPRPQSGGKRGKPPFFNFGKIAVFVCPNSATTKYATRLPSVYERIASLTHTMGETGFRF